MQQRIALYDLDRTVLATPTFTSFLIFAARKAAPWRLLMMPIWLLAMLGHAAGFYDRDRLKPVGIALFLGRRIDPARMQWLARAFADRRIPSDIQPGAYAAIERDRAEGFIQILATAAPEFYAAELADHLGFRHVLATRHRRGDDGRWLSAIAGTNCYGAEKRRRVEQWLSDQAIDRAACHIRFYTDDISDAPTLEIAHQGYAVNPGRKFAQAARLHGWNIVDFRTPAPRAEGD